jgi:hypothetical protein
MVAALGERRTHFRKSARLNRNILLTPRHSRLLTLYFLLTVPAGIELLKHYDRRFREQYQDLRIETETKNTRVGEMLLMLSVTRA